MKALELSKNMEEIRCEKTLTFTYTLWLKMYISIKRYGPMQPLHQIIPMQHLWWNTVKPGGDTITKLIEPYPIRHPHSNFETRAKLKTYPIQICSYKPFISTAWVKKSRCNGLRLYRNSASKRNSFFDTLLKFYEYFRDGPVYPEVSPTRPQSSTRSICRTSTGTRFQCTPYIITTPRTSLTSAKKSWRRLFNDDSHDAFSKRQRVCTGPPVMMNMDHGRQCWRCKKQNEVDVPRLSHFCLSWFYLPIGSG